MKRLIIGIGNEYCGNDAIGIIIACQLKAVLQDWDLKTGAFSGINFLEEIEGYDGIVVIDSLYKPDVPEGEIMELKIEDFAGVKSFSYIHSLNLASAIELGKHLELKLPDNIKIFGITVKKRGEIGQEIEQSLKKKIESIVKDIIKRIEN
ncbi:MAG: hydrogenase maturation protease [bacterium]